MSLDVWMQKLRLRWRSLLRRRAVEAELDEEIRYHLDQQIAELVASGVERPAARLEVLKRFGGVEQSKERCRDARGTGRVEAIAQDVRYALRTLRRNPAFATMAVLTMALGLGANTAVFSLVEGILLARLPYPAAHDLVSVEASYPGGAFAAMRTEVRTMDVGTYAGGHSFTLRADGEAERVAGTRISAELFPLLGAKPELGRWLRPGEDEVARDRYVILAHALWQSRFGGDETIVGRSIEIDGVAREVIAVMPASFQFPSRETLIWIPLGLDARDTARYWAGDFMPVVGRLRPGATRAAAQAEVRAFQSRVRELFPWPMPADWNDRIRLVPLREALVGEVRPRLLIMIAAVGVVLLVACANVANLSLSRAATREREIGIRAAIGAGPRRIAQQLLTESIVLALLGSMIGLLVAAEALVLLKLVLPPDTPRLAEVALDWRAVGFACLLAVITGCAAGLAPVLQALRVRLRAALEAGGRGGGRTAAGRVRGALVVAQVASAVLLVTAAGLLVRSLWLLSRTDPGFRPDQVVAADVSPLGSVCATTARCLAVYDTLAEEVRSAPGVRGAAFVNTLPLTRQVAKRSLELEGFVPGAGGTTAPLFWLNVITPQYFEVMGIRMEAGRAFTADDSSGPAVAIVSSATAQRYWPGESPLGKHVRFVGEQQWHEVVGVVSDVRAYDLARSLPEWMDGTIYVPHGPNATMEDGRIPESMTLVLKTGMDASSAAALLRDRAARVTSDLVVADVRPMHAIVAEAFAAPAATATVLTTMAGLALVLGCVGVYGVLSFLVSRQTRDLGIRIALGAQRRDVLWLVIREGAMLCAAGIALGIACALGATRWLSSELHGISPADPVTYLAVAVAVSIVTLLACYVPTRRAMSVDPLIALRQG